MFQTINYEWDIGKKNIQMAKKILAAEGIPLWRKIQAVIMEEQFGLLPKTAG